jgi:putative membrane protein
VKVAAGDAKIERLTRYLFNAPSWPVSLLIIIILGLIIDGASIRFSGRLFFPGTLGFTVPALIAFLLTKPAITLTGKTMTWNRSALLALACTVFAVIITLSPVLFSASLLPLFFAISVGFISGIRLVVLVAIADYRVPRMLPPALFQGVSGIIFGTFLFSPPFLTLALTLLVVFVIMFWLIIWLIERPLYRAFNIRVLSFLNAFIAHLTDGSKKMEDFFREIGEEVYVPEASLFFRRSRGDPVIFTVPNVHPGPMGDIGGGNLPRYLQQAFDGVVMVPHGCATHDFNLVSETEIEKIVIAVRKSMKDLHYSGEAARSERICVGSVSLLVQRVGNSFLMVGTRSPLRTEDLDFNIGMVIMSEGHKVSDTIVFVDAHNCMTEDMSPVHPATSLAREYQQAGILAFSRYNSFELFPLQMGVSHIQVPFSREDGFGDQGIQVLVLSVGGQKTAYVLFDGNNMQEGVREELRNSLLGSVDEVEIMTSDSHVVNTVTGSNPVGLCIPASIIVPYVIKGLNEAIADLGDSEAAGSTAECERIVVFGSQRIAQLASTVNAMLALIAPVSAALVLLAFILSFIAYMVIT